MNGEERKRRVDGALERALAPEHVNPRSGFEERLLANLAAEPERRPWWRWVWVPALAAAALVAIVFGIQAMRRTTPRVIESQKNSPAAQQTPNVVALDATVPPKTTTTNRASAAAKQHGPVVAWAKHSPHINTESRRGVVVARTLVRSRPFTAAPLTESERAMLAMLRQNPNEAGLLSERQQESNKQAEQFMEQAFRSGNQ